MIHKIIDYIKEDEFRMTIFNDRIYIVNYLDILSLEENRISIRYNEGRLVIKGESLTVAKLLDKEILIYGKVLEIEMSSK